MSRIYYKLHDIKDWQTACYAAPGELCWELSDVIRWMDSLGFTGRYNMETWLELCVRSRMLDTRIVPYYDTFENLYVRAIEPLARPEVWERAKKAFATPEVAELVPLEAHEQ